MTPPAFDTLMFEHIPKTAGESFRLLLTRQYRERLVLLTQVRGAPQRMREIGEAIAAGQPPRVIGSHVGWGAHERLPGDLRYAHVTLLRDPVERTISAYYYYKQRGGVKEETTLQEFCAPPPNPYAVFSWNVQTAFLGGLRIRQTIDRDPLLATDYNETLLEQAKTNVGECAMHGLVERFDESVLLLGRTFGWPLRSLRFVPRNRGKRRPQQLALTAEDRAALEAANRFDAALYEYASARFEALLAERVPDAEARLRALGRINKLYGSILPYTAPLRALRDRIAAR